MPEDIPNLPIDPDSVEFRDLTSLWQQDLIEQTSQNQGGVVRLKLPSGKVVDAHRLHLLHLLMNGNIPDALLPIVERSIRGTDAALAVRTLQEITDELEADPKAMDRIVELFDHVWMLAVVDPKFVRNPKDKTEIPMSTVSLDDKTFLFEWCQGVTADVASFRKQQDAMLANLQAGQSLFESTLGAVGNKQFDTQLAGVADK